MSNKLNLNFMGFRKLMGILSIVLIVGSIASLGTRFLALGLDFTGGTQIEVEYQGAVQLEPIRTLLKGSPYSDASVQHFGRPEEVLVRVPPVEGEDKAKVVTEPRRQLGDAVGHQDGIRKFHSMGLTAGVVGSGSWGCPHRTR